MPLPTDLELYRLFDRSPVGMYRSTERGRFLYVNPALARMLGYSVEELLAKNLNADVYLDGQDRIDLIAKFRAVGVLDGARVRWKDRDGRLKLVQIYGHIVESADPEPSFDASVVDVTESQRQQDVLERTAGILELVVRQMPAIYWIVDHDLRILDTGGAIQELLGYPRDTYIGTTLIEVHRVDPGSVDTVDAHRRALAGEIVTYASFYRSKHMTMTIAPLRRGDEIIGAIGSALDVTSSRALERRMVDAQRAESLGVLAGGLAHDFNNLLVAILGNADLGLRDIPRDAPGRLALENIRSASLRAAELTAQLLAYAGRGDFTPTRVATASVIEELVRITAATIPDHVRVNVELPGELAIRGDTAQVRQVVLNLIINARDALLETGGMISVTASMIRHPGEPDPDDVITAPPGTYVMLEIVDDGPGMTPETRRRIFEPFFTTKHTGHGLGLAAVLGIVRAHVGGLRVISELGSGAKFQVLWPADVVPDPIIVPLRTARRTVLVIDDEDRCAIRRPDDRGSRVCRRHGSRWRAGARGGRQPCDRRGARRPDDADDERRGRDRRPARAPASAAGRPVLRLRPGPAWPREGRRLPSQAVPHRGSRGDAREAPARRSVNRFTQRVVARYPARVTAPETPMPSIKVLLIEDDTRLAQLTARYLETHGVLVTIAGDGIEGQAEALRRQYDCIVLDLMLPGKDGLDVTRELRGRTDVPIVMVTARVEEADRVIGLEVGADDYSASRSRHASSRQDPCDGAPGARPGRACAADDPGRRPRAGSPAHGGDAGRQGDRGHGVRVRDPARPRPATRSRAVARAAARSGEGLRRAVVRSFDRCPRLAPAREAR